MKLEYMANLGYASMAPEAVCKSVADIGYQGVGWMLSHFDVMGMEKRALLDLVRLPYKYGMKTG